MDRPLILAFGILACIAEVALWHGPMGNGERFAQRMETQSRAVLDNYEMQQVDARIARDPLSRTLLLSGPADDFQRTELVKIMELIPGVGSARWVDAENPKPPRLPLLAEAELFGLAGFGLGLLLAYLLELRRRWRAEWRW